MNQTNSRFSAPGVVALFFAVICGALIGLPFKPGPGKLARSSPKSLEVKPAPSKPSAKKETLAPMQREVWRLLSPSAEGSEPVAKDIAKEIGELGAEALPVALDILLGKLGEPEGSDGVHPAALELRTEILKEAVQRYPAGTWMDALARATGKNAKLEVNLAAIGLLGDLGDASAVANVLEITRKLDSKTVASDQVADALESALGQILARDEQAFDALADELTGHSTPLQPAIARVLARSGSPRALELLSRCFGRSAELDRVLLVGLAACAAHPAGDLPESLTERARELLHHKDPAMRAAAAGALGALQDPFAADQLIALLDDDETVVAQAALKSLQQLSNLQLGADRVAWEGWYEEESSWYELDAADLTEALHSEDPTEAVSAIQTIVRHPLYRHSAAEGIGELLLGEDSEVALAACTALQQLGSHRAVQALEAGQLHARDEQVRAMCEQVLAKLANPEPSGR
jgi:HEAT repeat protein